MKKVKFGAMVLVSIFVIGCKSTKNTTKTQTTTTDKDKVPFRSVYITRDGLTLTELKRIYFYNSSEIKMTREVSKPTSKVVNGKVEIKESKSTEVKYVPAETVGVVIKSFKDKVLVSFSKKDPNFQFYFYLQSDGTYRLDPSNGGTMSYPETGKKYHIYSKNCKLLFSKNVEKKTEHIEDEAEGNDGS